MLQLNGLDTIFDLRIHIMIGRISKMKNWSHWDDEQAWFNIEMH